MSDISFLLLLTLPSITHSYDNRDRVTTVYLDADKDNALDTTESSVAYLYASGRLSGINTATTAYTITYDTFGNMVSVSAGGNVLATYTYTVGNGKLTRMTYGNGDYEEYSYDNLDRLTKVTYNGSSENAFTVLYDSNGRLAKAVDGKISITYLYEYDSLNRLIRAYQKDASGNTVYAVENSYDEYGRTKGSKIVIGDKTLSYTLNYKTNTNLVSGVSMPSGAAQSALSYTYDNFDRIIQKNSSLSTLADIYEKYEYHTYTDADGKVHTTPLISKLTLENEYNSQAISSDVYEYTYNALGYITYVSKNGTLISSYEYDALGQLIREDDVVNSKAYVYEYDNAGNILKTYTFNNTGPNVQHWMDVYPALGEITETYTYSTSAWGDLLTNYNGTTISYDEIGNPTNWRNASNLTWNGRTLTSQALTNGNSITYKYNSDGLRTQKSVFESSVSSYIVHDYVLDGTKILSETVTEAAFGISYTMYYVYDANGSITGLHYQNAPYYFQKNIQGDILRICNAAGNVVVEYTYDAWGNILSVSGTMEDTLGEYNPFRYRGYYYDSETGLYYLNSRYYDPQVGRFINADGIIGANGGIVGYNLFSYCNNNPVMFADPSGMCVCTGMDMSHCPECEKAMLAGLYDAEKKAAENEKRAQSAWFEDDTPDYDVISETIFSMYSVSMLTLELIGIAKDADLLIIPNALGPVGDFCSIILNTAVCHDVYVENGATSAEIADATFRTLLRETSFCLVSSGTGMVATYACTTYACLIGTSVSPFAGTLIGFGVGLAVDLCLNYVADRLEADNKLP